MYKIIGTKNCGKCNQVKTILNSKNIDYEYLLYDDLTNKGQETVLQIAKENSTQSFPLIFKDNEFISFENFLKEQ